MRTMPAILLSASNGEADKMGRLRSRIIVLRSDGGGVKDITPFDDAYVLPTSWRRR
jgi:hypothetical protein